MFEGIVEDIARKFNVVGELSMNTLANAVMDSRITDN